MKHKVLVLGSNRGQTRQRYNAIKELGYDVKIISDVSLGFNPGISKGPNLSYRILNKLGYPLDTEKLNSQVKLFFELNTNVKLVWVEKCLVLKPDTINDIRKKSPETIIAFYSGDDMTARHNQSRYFLSIIDRYDICFTTKSYNCNPNELPALGAKNIFFVNKSYDKYTHRPVNITTNDVEQYGCDVGFIGSFEEPRAEIMHYLARKGIEIRIFGNGWEKCKLSHENMKIAGIPLYEEKYVKGLCATKINLAFLRKMNRDLQTDRTMEVPACGAFMIAERTSEHLGLFEEGIEAEFFDIGNPDELLEKINFYLKNDEKRRKIAKNGRQRLLKDGHSHHDRIQQMFLKAGVNE